MTSIADTLGYLMLTSMVVDEGRDWEDRAIVGANATRVSLKSSLFGRGCWLRSRRGH